MDALNDDINTAKALSVVDELITEANDTLDKEPKNKNFKKELLANIEFVNDTLGIGLQDAYEYFQFGIGQKEVKSITELIINRSNAKKEKNFELSDKYRDELSAMGISLMDTVNGTVWEKN